MWVGEHNGYQNIIAEAAWASTRSLKFYLPRLHNITSERFDSNGKDSLGRIFDVYRFIGNDTPTYPTFNPSINSADVFSNTQAKLRGPTKNSKIDKDSIIDATIDITVPTNTNANERFLIQTESPFTLNLVNSEIRSKSNKLIATATKVEDDILMTLSDNISAGDTATISFYASIQAGFSGDAKTQQLSLFSFNDAADFSTQIHYTLENEESDESGSSEEDSDTANSGATLTAPNTGAGSLSSSIAKPLVSTLIAGLVSFVVFRQKRSEK